MKTMSFYGLFLAVGATTACQGGDSGGPLSAGSVGGKADSPTGSDANVMCAAEFDEAMREIAILGLSYEGPSEYPIGMFTLGGFIAGTPENRLAYFDPEYTQATFEMDFLEEGPDDAFKEAEPIGRWVWNALFGAHSVEPAWPCGHVLDGEITTSLSYDPQTKIETFTIKGSGDGGEDTCTGRGGPGSWSRSVTVTVTNNENDESLDQKGTLTIESYEE